jgi:hypothetical protein
MTQTIKPKRKFSTGAPAANQLDQGEIAINTADQKIYMKDDNGAVIEVANVSVPGATVDDATALAIALG